MQQRQLRNVKRMLWGKNLRKEKKNFWTLKSIKIEIKNSTERLKDSKEKVKKKNAKDEKIIRELSRMYNIQKWKLLKQRKQTEESH